VIADVPRVKLSELVGRYGSILSRDARQCKALLADVCGDQFRGECAVLIAAVEVGVAGELLNTASSLPAEVLLGRLSERLQTNRGVSADLARWGVECWAVALGMVAEGSKTLAKFKMDGMASLINLAGADGMISAAALDHLIIEAKKRGVSEADAHAYLSTYAAAYGWQIGKPQQPSNTAKATPQPTPPQPSSPWPPQQSTSAPPPPPPPARWPKGGWWIGLGGLIALIVLALAYTSSKLPPSYTSPQPSASPHVFMGPDGEWHPEDGYVWMANPHLSDDLRVRWVAGQPSIRYLHLESSETEGNWRPADGYVWVNNPPSVGDYRVKWAPGQTSNQYPNVISGETEGDWKPAPGYTWGNSEPKDYRVKPVEPTNPAPPPPAEPNNPPAANPELSTAFRDGLADRTAWEQWFSAQTGDYRDGGKYWSSERSSRRPGACFGAGRSPDFVNGCMAAKIRLDPTDIRRNSEPNYKAGWNSYIIETTTTPPTSSETLSPPPNAPGASSSQVQWYKNMDAPGNDLGGRDGWFRGVLSAGDCMQKCAADHNCVGFTYNIVRSVCIPKSRISSLIRSQEAAATGVMTDRAVPPQIQNIAGSVRQYPNMDAPGNDRGGWITGVSSSDCERICIADNGCAGYTYNQQRLTCVPKNIISGLAPSSEPAITGIVEGRDTTGR
jgi:hypothetical protein